MSNAIVTNHATNASTEQKSKINAVRKYYIETITPSSPGLTIVGIKDPSLKLPARYVIEENMKKGSNKSIFPIPKICSLTSIYSGNPRREAILKEISATNENPGIKIIHETKIIGKRDNYNFCSEEGLSVLLPMIKDNNSGVTFEQKIEGAITPELVDGLSSIKHAAKDAGTSVVMFAVTPEGYEKNSLHHYCDEYIEVAKCEPNPKANLAFSIDCVSLRDMNAFGIGRTMCNVKIENKKMAHRYSPFIANDLETRVMWVFHKKGFSLNEIGKILGYNKSTVLRRIKNLPDFELSEMNTKWLQSALQQLSVQDDSVVKNEK